MAQSVVCASCGAKIKAGRARCLRCGVQLPAVVAPSDGTRPSWKENHGLILAGAAVLVLPVVFLAMSMRGSPDSPSPAAPVSPPPPQQARKPDSAIGPTLVARPFLDSARAVQTASAAGSLDGAVDRFREAVQQNPDDAESLNNLGLALVQAGQTTQALPHLERATKSFPGVWEYRFNLARAYSQMEQWSRAAAEYRAALELFPDDFATHYNLGIALHRQGDEEAAVAEYRRAIELGPLEPSFHLALGISHERLKRPLDAADAYRQYLTMAPTAQDAEKVKAKIAALTASTDKSAATP
ncbi:MAG TPA: tetratricopeptide repeat protein [Vicinamibacterales bacterium]